MGKEHLVNKSEVRASCQKILRGMRVHQRYIKDKKVLQQLYRLIHQKRAKYIMAYVPLSDEVNLFPLLNRLRQEGRWLYVPFMEGESFRLVKYRYPLYKKKFGVKEPKDSKQYRVKEIDIAIVPFIGVDASWRRIGFGKGMYDRFFAKEAHRIKKTVLVSRYLCYSHEVVTDSYDVQADLLVVPCGTYKSVTNSIREQNR